MKNTELLFEFPIIIYDSLELNRAIKKDEDSFTDERTTVSYAIGKAKIQPQEIKGWYEGYTRDRTIDDVLDAGFNCTAVLTHSGDFLCSWKIGRFEEMYEKHMNTLQKFLDEETEKKLKELSVDIPTQEHY